MKRILLDIGAVLAVALLAVPASAQLAAAPPPPPPACTNPVYPYLGQSPGTAAPVDTPLVSSTQPQFAWPLPIPVDLKPDVTTFPGWDYYEIQAAPTNTVGPWLAPTAPTQTGTEWLGLCAPNTYNAKTNTCTYLYTPVWGYGQVNKDPATGNCIGPLGCNTTYPSMNIRSTRFRPVKVKWINNLPDQHLFCQQPQNSNWPCAIDRTLMGTQVGTGVTQYGGSQQPDNAFVVHFHGGDVPPEADGFAEFWVGNKNTSAAYTPTLTTPIDPPLSQYDPANPTNPIPLVYYRPIGTSVLYNYPMEQAPSMVWFHDHALGKTRINVVAGPAGFFHASDPTTETFLCSAVKAAGLPAGTPCVPDGKYEINIALQDRDFNAPQLATPTISTINYPNGMNWTPVAPVPCQTAVTPGGNPTVHPQWVPEYFGTFAIVNGKAWPFLNVEPRKYRFFLLAGSNSRCWNVGRSDGLPFTIIGSDQGYLPAPVQVTKLTMCPGERYDTVFDFSMLLPGAKVTLTNNAPAPFPKGVGPTASDVGRVMQFRVLAGFTPDTTPLPATLVPLTPVVPAASVPCTFTPAVGGQGLHTTGVAGCIPMRQKNLNEQLDATTLFPLRVQIDGTPFEGAITETPKLGAKEMWKIVNTTGDAHPIHTHLVRHQIVSRQKFDTAGYSAATNFAVPIVTGAPAPPVCPPNTPAATLGCFNLGVDITPFLIGGAKPPGLYEAAFKDTSISYPGEVLTIVAEWTGHWPGAIPPAAVTAQDPQATQVQVDANGVPVVDPITKKYVTEPLFWTDATMKQVTNIPTAFPKPVFVPVTSGPYVWHCHIVDHEDNEMMRPVLLQP